MGSDEEQYYKDLEASNVRALWKMNQDTEPPVFDQPFVWHWKDLHPKLMAAADHVLGDSGTADRRVLTMRNPGFRNPHQVGATHSLVASLQMILPGEVAPAHRHTFSALRFIMTGGGGYTVVDGERIFMEPGDLLLTPNWLWHDHRHEGKEPLIWFDGLDFPFVAHGLHASFYQDYPGITSQPIDKPEDQGRNRFGAGWLVSAKDKPPRDSIFSPLNVFKWEPAYDGLLRMQHTEPDPYEGYLMEYINPATGGHVLPTIASYLQSLPKGTHTKAARRTSSSVYLVFRGSGYSVVNGKRLDWEDRDIVAVPSWNWSEHVAERDTIFFRISDIPMQEPFGLHREEVYLENGGFQKVQTQAAERVPAGTR